MNILFLSHYFTPEGNAPARRVHKFCREWVNAGHQVTVLTGIPNVPNGVAYEGYRNAWHQEEIIDGIRVIRVWTYLAPNKGTALRIVNYLSFMFIAVVQGLFLRKPDIIVATSPQFFCAWAGRLLAGCKRTPFVLEIRDLWPASIQAVGAIRSSAVLHFLEMLERLLYRHSPCMVTVGDGYKTDLLARGVPAKHVHVIPNALNLESFAKANGDSIRARLGLGAKDFVCAYVGTIGMACGLDVALEAARLLRATPIAGCKVVFLLVGDGASLPKLQQQARADNLNDVIFTGRIPHDEVYNYLAAADACLVHLIRSPTFTTVIPTKLLEAAALSKPVILGVTGSAETLVKKAGAGLCIPPQDAAALVGAITKLQGDPAARMRYGQSGRAYIAAEHDLGRLSAAYLNLLTTIVAQRSG